MTARLAVVTGGAGFIGSNLVYAPAVAFEEGLRRTIDWIERERAADLR